MNDSIACIVVILLMLLLWSVFMILGALIFTWSWNLLLPLLWAAAPKIGFWHAIAAGFLIGAVKSVISFSTYQNAKS